MPTNAIRLHAGDAPPLQPETQAPLLIGAKDAGPFVGISEAGWWRLHAAGKTPAPLKLGKKTLWRRRELEAWVAAGCPARKVWEAMEKAKG